MSSKHPFAARPWLSAYPDDVPHEIGEVTESLTDMMGRAIRRYGHRPALEFFGKVTNYSALGEQIERAAQGLRELGVSAGDRVAIILPNCPQHVVAFYAVVRLGAIVVEHNPLYTSRELRKMFENHGATFAIVWDKLVDSITEFPSDVRPDAIISVNMIEAMPKSMRFKLRLPVPAARKAREALTAQPTASDITEWQELLSSRRLPRRYPKPELGDLALLQYTSGTTGEPKAAKLTHKNLVANAMQGRAWVPGLRVGEEVFYGVLPLFHAYGMTLCLTFGMSMGARLVLFPKFDTKLIIDAMAKTPATFFPGVPPIYDQLCRVAEQGKVNLRSIRYALSGAVNLPPQTVERWESHSNGLLVEGYGMTESAPVAAGNPMGRTRRPGTVGVPFPSTEIRVVDPDDPTRDLDVDQAGELLIRGPQVFSGYWHRPEETEQVLSADGWLRTGDLVTVSEDGFITIVGRLKELIITGGFNVSPVEVEEVLLTHPDIDDAAVVGLPREDGGEIVAASVALRPESAITDGEIRDYCRERLTPYKVPREIDTVDTLPRTMVGKVLRREVREQMIARRGVK